MKNIEFKVDDQIIETLKNYADKNQIDVYKLANEILEITIKRLNLDILEQYNSDEDEKFNKMQLTSKNKEQEIRNFFGKYNWTIFNEENCKLGEVFEKFVGRKVFYYLTDNIEYPFMIISEVQMDFFSELTKHSDFETNQIFSWIGQYNKEIKLIKYIKDEKIIDVIIC